MNEGPKNRLRNQPIGYSRLENERSFIYKKLKRDFSINLNKFAIASGVVFINGLINLHANADQFYQAFLSSLILLIAYQVNDFYFLLKQIKEYADKYTLKGMYVKLSRLSLLLTVMFSSLLVFYQTWDFLTLCFIIAIFIYVGTLGYCITKINHSN
ncbi:hypothetical protein [Apilactobacillus xinyiensis]|uniref:Uncharacterized protein n=1 Tax=Apilactobacillus xinyiensis TaxID=2841032 RepID=A0ABT0I1D0_9LACO|nr:hypothetical protein [Apilactobacillus xinyiensis]MCK8624522.1 hypothetical protein [Apilactobacillus xinyiensis]MCL0319462.1 hypothetical protein [Apilactobacillus xinyiensis]MCL0330771.1 hypothetical protein [Apilactobacillus xinyiensis]